MKEVVEASVTVHTTGVAGVEQEDRIEFTGKTILVGKKKIKVASLREAPRDSDGKLTLVAAKVRVVIESTPASRAMAEQITAAHLRRWSQTGSRQPPMAAAEAAARSRRGVAPMLAFRPMNTLEQTSRPGSASRGGFGGNGGGGKRGKRMAAAASAACLEPSPKAPLSSLSLRSDSKRGGLSSGPVSRRRRVTDNGDDDDDELEELGEVGDRRGGRRSSGGGGFGQPHHTQDGGNSSNSGGGGHFGIREYLTSVGGNSGSGGGNRHGVGGNELWPKNMAQYTANSPAGGGRQGGSDDRSWTGGDGGSSPPMPPMLRWMAATNNMRDGMPGRRGGYGGFRPLHPYLTHREPSMSRREGFRNVGNTCYLNACVQGLLSLSGFVRDLQRECWVLAMLKPPPALPPPVPKSTNGGGGGGSGGSEAAIDSGDPPVLTIRESKPPMAGSGGGGRQPIPKPSLYDALLRLSLEAKGSHGLMDASPLKRAMDRRSDRFAGNFQQDAHEFLSDLINVLHEEMHPRLDVAGAHVRKFSVAPVVAGGGEAENATAAAAAMAVAAGVTMAAATASGQATERLASGVARRRSAGGPGGGDSIGGGGSDGGDAVVMVDLSSTDAPEVEECPKPNQYDGGWDDDDDDFIAGAVAAATAVAAACGAVGSQTNPAVAGAEAAVEVLEVDSDSTSCCGDAGDGASGIPTRLTRGDGTKGGIQDVEEMLKDEGGAGGRGSTPEAEPTAEAQVAATEEQGAGGEEVEPEDKREGEEELASREQERERERLMPTTRHFHAEVEVSLTCTRCSYSRRRRELYRDFSLDIPDPATRQPQENRGVDGGQGKRGIGAYGLDTLLEGFFKPAELNLRCEQCGHDRVRVEHSLAELPGALVLHIKRFKPVVTSADATTAATATATSVDTSAGAKLDGSCPPDNGSLSQPPAGRPANTTGTNTTRAAADGGRGAPDGGGVTTPPAAILVGGESTYGSSQSGGGGGGSRPFGGVSYVKLTAPVSVPLQLDLDRFCTEFTGNAPTEDLGKVVDSLEILGSPFSSLASAPSGTSIGGAPGRRDKSTPGVGARRGNHKAHPDGVSVDLSLREGWSSGTAAARTSEGGDGSDVVDNETPFRFPSPLPVVREGEEDGVGGGAIGGIDGGVRGPGPGTCTGLGSGVRGGVAGKRGSALFDSTNSSGGRGSVKETATEKRRRREKEKENAAAADRGRDRWADQDTHHHHARSRHMTRPPQPCAGVLLDAAGKVDYLAALATGRNYGGSGGSGARLSPLAAWRGGTRGSAGGRGRLGGGQLGWPWKNIQSAEDVSRNLLMQRKLKRQRDVDDQEREQIQAAIAASNRDATGFRGTAPLADDDEEELARAIYLSQEVEQPGAWTCSVCTLVNDPGISGPHFRCEACNTPKPESPPPSPPLGDPARGGRRGDESGIGGQGGVAKGERGGGGGGGGKRGHEDDEVFILGDRKWAAGGASPVSSGTGGAQYQRRPSLPSPSPPPEQHQREQEGIEQKYKEESRGEEREVERMCEGKREGEGRESSASPGPQPRRVAGKGPLRARYELRGVLHHLGQHAFAGHYVTDVRRGAPTSTGHAASDGGDGRVDRGTPRGKTAAEQGSGGNSGGWERHDDSVVAPMSEAKALEGAAQRTCYVCFYSLVGG